ncbi:MAG: hypothetical protein AAGA32_00070 [Pseudomonadota bacterium]
MILSRRSVGIYFGHRRAHAVLRGRRGALRSASARLPEAIWQEDGTDLRSTFAALARGLGAEALRADVRTAVALPDPVALEDVLSFADVPETPRALDDLVRFRIAREHRSAPERVVCTVERLETSETGTDLLVRVLSAARVAAIQSAAREAGFRLHRLETLARYAPAEGMVIACPDGWWSVRTHVGGAMRTFSDWGADESEAARRIGRVVRSVHLKDNTTPAPITLVATAPLARSVCNTLSDLPEPEIRSPDDPNSIALSLAPR